MLFNKVDTFKFPLSTGQISVDTGFEPKLLLFQTTGSQDDDPNNVGIDSLGAVYSFGAVCLGGQLCTSMQSQNHTDPLPKLTYGQLTDDRCITFQKQAFLPEQGGAGIISLDQTGFTIDVLTTDASMTGFKQPTVQYMALGGNDIEQVAISHFTSPNAVTAQAVTGLGFQPDVLIFFSQMGGSVLPANQNTSYQTMGWANASGQFSFGMTSYQSKQNPSSLAIASRHSSDSYIFVGHRGDLRPTTFTDQQTLTDRASLTSLDADGFTLNWDRHATGAFEIAFIAIKGSPQFRSAIGTYLSAAGTVDVTGIGFRAQAGLFGSNGALNNPAHVLDADFTEFAGAQHSVNMFGINSKAVTSAIFDQGGVLGSTDHHSARGQSSQVIPIIGSSSTPGWENNYPVIGGIGYGGEKLQEINSDGFKVLSGNVPNRAIGYLLLAGKNGGNNFPGMI